MTEVDISKATPWVDSGIGIDLPDGRSILGAVIENDDDLRKTIVCAANRDHLFDEMVEALRETWRVIDAAGLRNLSNGVQLGPTAWCIKANDVRELSLAILAKVQP